MIRLFCAISIPDEGAQSLAKAQTGLREARWRTAEQLHITLRFFGDVDERRAEDIASALEAAAGPPFHLSLSGVGHFGEGERIHAIWAGVEASHELNRLAARCESAARRAGCEADTRNYLPHVTLAYLKRPQPEAVAEWIAQNNLLKTESFRVERFGLYSSWPSEGGSRYEMERFYRLEG